MSRALFDVRGIRAGEVAIFYQDGKRAVEPTTEKPAPTSQTPEQAVIKRPAIHLSIPTPHVTDNLCKVCGSLVPGKRHDRAFCSARCRKQSSRDIKGQIALGILEGG